MSIKKIKKNDVSPESITPLEGPLGFLDFLGIDSVADFILTLAGIAALIGTWIAIKTYINREKGSDGKKGKEDNLPPGEPKSPDKEPLGPVNDFQARLGNSANPGFLPGIERLAQIKAGRNPFVHGTALPENSPVFFGRAQIMHGILSVLRHPGKPGCVSLLGDRRMGKSSLLNQVFAALGKEEGLVTIIGNTQSWSEYSPAAFFFDLHRAIADVLSTDEPASSSSLPTVVDYPGFRDFIRHHADRHRFILILDEFEIMARDPKFDATFFNNLRHLGYTPQLRFGYLLASRKPLSELRKRDPELDGSSFWNMFSLPHVVGLLQPKDTLALIEEPWRKSLPGGVLSPEERETMKKWVGDHPALRQMVLGRMWTARAGQYELDLDEIRRGLWGYFDGLWQHRSEEEKALLLKIADTGQAPDNKLSWDLRSRGLITGDNRLFSEFFEDFVIRRSSDFWPELLPDH